MTFTCINFQQSNHGLAVSSTAFKKDFQETIHDGMCMMVLSKALVIVFSTAWHTLVEGSPQFLCYCWQQIKLISRGVHVW